MKNIRNDIKSALTEYFEEYNWDEFGVSPEALAQRLESIVDSVVFCEKRTQRDFIISKCEELNKRYGAVPNDFRHWIQDLLEETQLTNPSVKDNPKELNQ